MVDDRRPLTADHGTTADGRPPIAAIGWSSGPRSAAPP
jgi:hypothetical protein